MTLALILAAAADGDLIPGKVIVALFSAIFAAGGGIWIGRKGGESAAEKTFEKREQEIRTQIANELQAKITNDPLHVAKVQSCVSIGECNRRMKDLDDRVTRLEEKFDNGISKIIDKLSAMDREGEQRAVALHRRMDALSEKTSETAGAVELIKAKMFKRS